MREDGGQNGGPLAEVDLEQHATIHTFLLLLFLLVTNVNDMIVVISVCVMCCM